VNERWDTAALKAGASVALVFAAPFLVAARLIADRDDSSLVLPLVLIAILGFVLGAGVAAWRQQLRTPLSHGIVTSGATFAAVQGVLVVINLIRGTDVRWFNIFFNFTVAVFAGLIGGLLGMNLQKRGLEPNR